MPRSLRIEYPAAFQHVIARGNRREAISRDEEDRRLFLKTLGEACGMTGWQVHAWALMGNHYHLLLETQVANLVAGMGWLQSAYTRRVNTRHRLWGRLFRDRYKAVLTEGGSKYYCETLMIVTSGLAAAGLTQDDVAQLPEADPRKVAIARLIWEGTTMSQGWVAERLRMRSAANVSQQLRRGPDRDPTARLPAALRRLIDVSRVVA